MNDAVSLSGWKAGIAGRAGLVRHLVDRVGLALQSPVAAAAEGGLGRVSHCVLVERSFGYRPIDPETGESETAGDVRIVAVFGLGPGQQP